MSRTCSQIRFVSTTSKRRATVQIRHGRTRDAALPGKRACAGLQCCGTSAVATVPRHATPRTGTMTHKTSIVTCVKKMALPAWSSVWGSPKRGTWRGTKITVARTTQNFMTTMSHVNKVQLQKNWTKKNRDFHVSANAQPTEARPPSARYAKKHRAKVK